MNCVRRHAGPLAGSAGQAPLQWKHRSTLTHFVRSRAAGPGCSGLIGFLSENGPLVPQADGSLDQSPLSWNTLANTLYVESPAFVGFSGSDSKHDLQSNDTKTATDNYRALEAFYDKFPELSTRDMYFTGESYAGNYVPQLSELVVRGPNTTLRCVLFQPGPVPRAPHDSRASQVEL